MHDSGDLGGTSKLARVGTRHKKKTSRFDTTCEGETEHEPNCSWRQRKQQADGPIYIVAVAILAQRTVSSSVPYASVSAFAIHSSALPNA